MSELTTVRALMGKSVADDACLTGRALFDAANLHVGGGVQVAASVFTELADLASSDSNFDVSMSRRVSREIASKVWRHAQFEASISNAYGMGPIREFLRSDLDRYDAVYTIFGPLYRWRRRFRSIVGFAQPWIIYPDTICYERLSYFSRLKTRLKFWIQGVYFKRADILVVELEHVKAGLVRELGISPERIHVIHNCLGSIYHEEAMWKPVHVPDAAGDLRLGFVGRNYLHKNTAIFPAIVSELRNAFGISAKFFVTFTEEEWDSCEPDFRRVCENVGPLAVAQCPSFYQAMDAVVFPSLLECFSATPLEAMAMQKPLFASDMPFNTDVCGKHAHYFDPLNPIAAARSIATVFDGAGPDANALRYARAHALEFSNPRDRAQKMLSLLQNEMGKAGKK